VCLWACACVPVSLSLWACVRVSPYACVPVCGCLCACACVPVSLCTCEAVCLCVSLCAYVLVSRSQTTFSSFVLGREVFPTQYKRRKSGLAARDYLCACEPVCLRHSVCVCVCVCEWVSEWVNKSVNKWVSEWMSERASEWHVIKILSCYNVASFFHRFGVLQLSGQLTSCFWWFMCYTCFNKMFEFM